MRVAAFIDGFNLYHAIDDQGPHHLKWVNLRALVQQFTPAPQYDLADVFYFSAYATWRPDAYARHRAYVRALTTSGVTPIMGRFKEKYRRCRSCGAQWKDHEEKETDVNIALHLLSAAQKNMFDRAVLVTGDSDLTPVVRMIAHDYPSKQVRILAPLARPYSMELVSAAGGSKSARRIKPIHLERSLFPQYVYDEAGCLVATRPAKYAPPLP